MTLEILTHDLLAPVRHGFFTRRGGASSGIYAGLNCSPGSSDQIEAVSVNRARVAEAMHVVPLRLLSLHQVHSADVVVATADGWSERPRADAAVKVAIHRLRVRFREILRAEVAATVHDPAEAPDELRHLITIVSAG